LAFLNYVTINNYRIKGKIQREKHATL